MQSEHDREKAEAKAMGSEVDGKCAVAARKRRRAGVGGEKKVAKKREGRVAE